MTQATFKQSDQDLAKPVIKKVLAELARPKEVKAVDYEFGEDSTGAPAVWIYVRLDDDNPSPEIVAKLSDYSRAVSQAILDSGIDFWPFVKFRATD